MAGEQPWRLMAERALTPADEPANAVQWQQLLEDRYMLEVVPTHGALWERTVSLLVRHGKPLSYSNGPIYYHPMQSPLSTGMLLLEEPRSRDGGLTMTAARLTVADHQLRSRDLPMKRIAEGAKAGKGPHFEAAVQALGGCTSLTTVQLELMTLANKPLLLTNKDAMRGKLREANPRRSIVRADARISDMIEADHLERAAEVALWCRPIDVFGPGRSAAIIRRPEPPRLTLPRRPSIEEGHEAVSRALRVAQDEQPHAAMLLDILMETKKPVRSLGKRAMAIFNEGDD